MTSQETRPGSVGGNVLHRQFRAVETKVVLPSSGDVLPLQNLEPFGVGGRRLCFAHPYDSGKCVKVLRTDDRRTIRVRKKKSLIPSWLRREYDNNAHEQRILEQLYRRIGPQMNRHFPVCHGLLATDLGPGLVLDLIRDHDGRISRSVRELISTGVDISTFRPAFEQFGAFLKRHRVLTRQLLDHNLVARNHADHTWDIYLIDGFGDPAWLPFARWFRPLGRARIDSRLAAAWPRMEAFARSGGVTGDLIATSTWDQGFLRHRDG